MNALIRDPVRHSIALWYITIIPSCIWICCVAPGSSFTSVRVSTVVFSFSFCVVWKLVYGEIFHVVRGIVSVPSLKVKRQWVKRGHWCLKTPSHTKQLQIMSLPTVGNRIVQLGCVHTKADIGYQCKSAQFPFQVLFLFVGLLDWFKYWSANTLPDILFHSQSGLQCHHNQLRV